MSSEFEYIVFPSEAEAFVESLESLEYDIYGLERWYKQHVYLDKLNMQAVVSAKSGSDEFVKEFIISHQKVGFLVRDLIATEIWQYHVLKRVIKQLPKKIPSFPLYIIPYHELVVANLLETIAYHIDIVDGLSNDAADVCDWCHRALCRLVSLTATDEKKTELQSLKDKAIKVESITDELHRQSRIIAYEVSMKAVSLSRHLIEHSCNCHNSPLSGQALPLSVGRRLLHTHDFLILLCQLIDLAPWNCEVPPTGTCRRPIRYQWHESGCWIPESDEKNWTPVTRTEGQVWLAIYQLLFSNIFRSVNYDLTVSHRRQALLRLRPFLTEVKIDIIPVLGELRRFLEQFAVSEGSTLAVYGQATRESASAVAQLCHVEVVAEIYEGVKRMYTGKWETLAEEFVARIQTKEGKDSAQRAASNWADTFSEDNVNALFGYQGVVNDGGRGDADTFEHPLLPPPRCVTCGELATKRCSRCRQEWYCRRECQVKHWPKHRKACDVLMNLSAPSGGVQEVET